MVSKERDAKMCSQLGAGLAGMESGSFWGELGVLVKGEQVVGDSPA